MGDPSTFDITGELPSPATTMVLEASAGTGKTWTIEALVVRLLAAGEVEAHQVLVVTFTIRATADLRNRIRRRLVETIAALVGNAPADAVSSDTDPLVSYLLSQPDPRVIANRLTRAVADFDQATITTIHAFCQQALATLGITAAAPPPGTFTDDVGPLARQVLHDEYVRHFHDAEKPYPWRTAVRDLLPRLADEPFTPLARAGRGDGTAERTRDFARALQRGVLAAKARQQMLSFSDLLHQLASAVADADGPAARALRARWSLLLVDEFQDTDPVQWQILSQIFTHHCRVVLIGDPKQAIYSFRGGDVHTYTQAVSTADVRAQLGSNHRSTAGLVQAFNEIFTSAPLGDARSAGIKARPVRSAARTTREVSDRPSVQIRAVLPSSPGTIDGSAMQHHMIDDLAGQVRELLQSQWSDGTAVQADDIAILCSTHAQLRRLARRLQVDGVPISLVSGTVAGSEAFSDLRWLVQAMADPGDVRVVNRAALTPLIGASTEQVREGTEALSDTMRAWAEVLPHEGLRSRIEGIVAAGLADRLAGAASGDVARYLTDLRHTVELSETEAQASSVSSAAASFARPSVSLHRGGPGHFVDAPTLARWMQEGGQSSPRRPASDQSAIHLGTIHGAKGLEFGVVLLPYASLSGGPLTGAQPFHDADGKRTFQVTSTPETARLVKEEAEAEGLRTLYVAFTRACSHVIGWWIPSPRSTTGSMLHRLLVRRSPSSAHTIARGPLGKDPSASVAQLQQWSTLDVVTVGPGGNQPPVTSERATVNRQVSRTVGGAAVRSTGEEHLVESVPYPVGSVPSRHGEPRHRWAVDLTRPLDTQWRRTSYTAIAAAGDVAPVPLAHEGWEDDGLTQDEFEPLGIDDDIHQANANPESGDAVPSLMANLPRGAAFGSLIHDVLEHLDPAAPDLLTAALDAVEVALPRWPVALDDDQRRQTAQAIAGVCTTALTGLFEEEVSLADIGVSARLPELDFDLPLDGGLRAAPSGPSPTLADIGDLLTRWLPEDDPLAPFARSLESRPPAGRNWAGRVSLRGYLTGSIDAVLRVGHRYAVVDYKTNWLAPPGADLRLGHYDQRSLSAAMVGSSYPLQALLYSVAAHRFLRLRLPGYDPETNLGAVGYLYVRGMAGAHTPVTRQGRHGVFAWRPPAGLVVELSEMLAGGKSGGSP